MVTRILICTGGTGGHIFPALALAKQLKQEIPHSYIYFAGGGLSKNRFFEKDAHPYSDIATGQFSRKKPLTCIRSFGKVVLGFLQSRRLLKSIRPDIVIGFGSYHTFPLLLATRFMGFPYMLQAADSIPGKVIRFFSKKAVATGIVFPEARKRLKGHIVDVQLPLREAKTLSRQEALTRYGLKEGKKTLLVFGGSQGASSINDILEKAIGRIEEAAAKMQVIHLVGMKGDSLSLEKAYRSKGIEAYVKTFEERMDYAWTAADVVVSRAGGGTIAQQIAFEVPGILIPYPYASEDHQKKNADYMCRHVGGALMLSENEFTFEAMATNLGRLFRDKEELLKMKNAIRRYKEKEPVEEMVSLVKRMLPIKKGES